MGQSVGLGGGGVGGDMTGHDLSVDLAAFTEP